MASQVPKRVIVVIGKGIQISVLQNFTFLLAGLGNGSGTGGATA